MQFKDMQSSKLMWEFRQHGWTLKDIAQEFGITVNAVNSRLMKFEREREKLQESELRRYKKKATKAAKELTYGKDVIAEIQAAGSIRDIERIMKKARHEKLG